MRTGMVLEERISGCDCVPSITAVSSERYGSELFHELTEGCVFDKFNRHAICSDICEGICPHCSSEIEYERIFVITKDLNRERKVLSINMSVYMDSDIGADINEIVNDLDISVKDGSGMAVIMDSHVVNFEVS